MQAAHMGPGGHGAGKGPRSPQHDPSKCPFSLGARSGPPLDEHALFCVSALWSFVEKGAEEMGVQAFHKFVEMRAASGKHPNGAQETFKMTPLLAHRAKQFAVEMGQAITGYKSDSARLAKQLHDLAKSLAPNAISWHDLETLFDCFRAAIKEALGILWNDDVGAVLAKTFGSFLGVMEPALSMLRIGSKGAFLGTQRLAVCIDSVDEESKELVRYSWGMIADHEAMGFGLFVHMFRLSPTTLKLFSFKDEILASKSDGLKNHVDKFVKELGFLVKRMDSPSTFTAAVRVLASSHCKWHVVPGHLPFMGKALLKSLEETLGASWSPRLEQAWRLVWEAVASCFSQCLSVQEDVLQMHELLRTKFTSKEAQELAGVVQFNTKTHAVHAVFETTVRPNCSDADRQSALSGLQAHHGADEPAPEPKVFDIKVCFASACLLYVQTPTGMRLVSCPDNFGDDRLGLSIVATEGGTPVLLVYTKAKACYVNLPINDKGLTFNAIVSGSSPMSCTCTNPDGNVYGMKIKGVQDHTQFISAVERCRRALREERDMRPVGSKDSGGARRPSADEDAVEYDASKRSRASGEESGFAVPAPRAPMRGKGAAITANTKLHFATLCLLYEFGSGGWALAKGQSPFDVNGELCIAIVSEGEGTRRCVAVYDKAYAVVLTAPLDDFKDTIRMCSGGAEFLMMDCNDKRWTVQMSSSKDVIRFGVEAFGELRLASTCPLESHCESFGNSIEGPGSVTVAMGSIDQIMSSTGLTVTMHQSTLQGDLDNLQHHHAAHRAHGPATACPHVQAPVLGGGEGSHAHIHPQGSLQLSGGCAMSCATRSQDSFKEEKRQPLENPELSVEAQGGGDEDEVFELGSGLPRMNSKLTSPDLNAPEPEACFHQAFRRLPTT